MAAIWSGAIAFGLVNIPVKLFSATQDDNLDLDMLDSHDLQRVRYKRVNEKTGKEVPWEKIVKGYKYNDHYVVLDDKDFERASPKKSREITLDFFCPLSDIESIYYETPYYAEPEKNGSRAYGLLREALTKARKAAVGSFVLRNREHLCVLRPYEKVLLVQTIRFAAEIRKPVDVAIPAAKPAELKMATTLIDQLSADFDISSLKDTYTDQLLTFIKAKAKGKKTTSGSLKVVHVASGDLLDQLKASMQQKKKRAS